MERIFRTFPKRDRRCKMSWIASMIVCLALTWGATGVVVYKMIKNTKK